MLKFVILELVIVAYQTALHMVKKELQNSRYVVICWSSTYVTSFCNQQAAGRNKSCGTVSEDVMKTKYGIRMWQSKLVLQYSGHVTRWLAVGLELIKTVTTGNKLGL
jgi:hypothetical protein